jgi:hypothetical protein
VEQLIMNNEITTLDEYKKGLECFDWYYNYSDDYSVWSSGQRRMGELTAAQKKFDPDRTIWEEVRDRKMK